LFCRQGAFCPRLGRRNAADLPRAEVVEPLNFLCPTGAAFWPRRCGKAPRHVRQQTARTRSETDEPRSGGTERGISGAGHVRQRRGGRCLDYYIAPSCRAAMPIGHELCRRVSHLTFRGVIAATTHDALEPQPIHASTERWRAILMGRLSGCDPFNPDKGQPHRTRARSREPYRPRERS
jgi:hypothetical protein